MLVVSFQCIGIGIELNLILAIFHFNSVNWIEMFVFFISIQCIESKCFYSFISIQCIESKCVFCSFQFNSLNRKCIQHVFWFCHFTCIVSLSVTINFLPELLLAKCPVKCTSVGNKNWIWIWIEFKCCELELKLVSS